MKKFALVMFSIFMTYVHAESFPTKKEVLVFADILDQHLMTKRNKLRNKDVKLLEFLLYKDRVIAKSLENDEEFTKKFSLTRKLIVNKLNRTIQFSRGINQRRLKVIATFSEDSVDWTVVKRSKDIEFKGSLKTKDLSDEYISLVQTKVYDQVQMERGYTGLQKGQNLALNAEGEIKLEDKDGKAKLLRIKEKFVRDNQYDNTEWKYVPVKLITYPAQKIMYEIPALLSNTAIESVTRSPLHNLQGTGDEFKGAGKSLWNGFVDLVRGIANPKKGTSIDGLLTIADGGFKVVKAGAGIVKTTVSLIGYPIYRAFGGKKSKRVALKGKRAAIVVIDTGTYVRFTDVTIDTYGEMIVRNQLKSVSDYYCVSSNAEDNDLYDCIDNMPDKIEYVDLFALTHSGGDSSLDRLAKYAAKVKGVKPELIVSIGCYDDPSTLVEKENTVGQEGTSWAVHFYLSNLIGKRLRGIPMEKAANEAFYGSMPINAINPISIGGVAAVGVMDGNIKEGYFGSKPELYTDDSIAKDTIRLAWSKVRSNISDIETIESESLSIYEKYFRLSRSRNDYKNLEYGKELPEGIIEQVDLLLEENMLVLNKAHNLLEDNREYLSKDVVKILNNSKILLAKINTMTKSELVAQYMKIQNYEVALNENVRKEIEIY